jgi:hypothetical protein
MNRLRYTLIALYVAGGLTGIILMWTRAHGRLALTIFAVAMVCMSTHMLLEHLDNRRERASKVAWEREVRRVADDLNLEGYGLTSIAELASYHDAAGRDEVLAALRALPAGQRRLFTAARQVDPDGAWD